MNLIKKILTLAAYPIFRLLDLLTPKDSKLCVFGSQAGTRYFDNSKYLYEYILENRQDISAVWLTSNRSQSSSHTYIYSAKGLWYAFRAKYKFVSYGLYDLGLLRFSNRSKVVQLWHGVPLKNIFLLEPQKQSFINKVRNLRELSGYSNFICCSELEARHLSNCTKLDKKKIIITGYPRNDFLHKPIRDERLELIKLKWSKLILYAPTFRDDYSPFSLITLHTLKDLLIDLKSKNCALLVRAHATEAYWRGDSTISDISNALHEHDNLIYVDNYTYPDVQDLMKISNILISDYSGIIVDYLLLYKPIIRYCPDIERYSKERGLIPDFTKLKIGEFAHKESELKHKIFSALDKSSPPEYDVKTFHEWQDASSCKRILATLNI